MENIETAEFFLNIYKIGQKAHEGFIIQCIKDPNPLENAYPATRFYILHMEVHHIVLEGQTIK